MFGLVVAWVLVRYRFPGRGLVDALVDLPFALPTAVAGITLTTLLAKNGWIGRWLEPLGIEVAYTPLGVVVALTFIGLPFVVRTVQPVLEDLEPELEEAAASLGASRWQTFRARALPDALAGARDRLRARLRARASASTARSSSSRATCRCSTEIAPLLIVTQLEQYDYAGADRDRGGAARDLVRAAARRSTRSRRWRRGASRRAEATREPPSADWTLDCAPRRASPRAPLEDPPGCAPR